MYDIILKVIEEQEDLAWGIGTDGWMNAEELAKKITLAIVKNQIVESIIKNSEVK